MQTYAWLSFLIFVVHTQTVLYVSPQVGNDNTGDGSFWYPFQTISKAYTVANKNSTLQMMLFPGNYSGTQNLNLFYPNNLAVNYVSDGTNDAAEFQCLSMQGGSNGIASQTGSISISGGGKIKFTDCITAVYIANPSPQTSFYVDSVSFINTANSQYGVYSSTSSSLTISNCQFVGPNTQVIATSVNFVNITGSSFSSSVSAVTSSALFISCNDVFISSTSFSNTTLVSKVAPNNSNTQITISNLTMQNGANTFMQVEDCSLSLTNAQFSSGKNGGIFATNSLTAFVNVSLSNFATQPAVWLNNTQSSFSSCDFTSNSGGALVAIYSTISIQNSSFLNNSNSVGPTSVACTSSTLAEWQNSTTDVNFSCTTANPPIPPNPTNSESSSDGGSDTWIWYMVGVIAGVVAFVVILLGGCCCWMTYKRSKFESNVYNDDWTN